MRVLLKVGVPPYLLMALQSSDNSEYKLGNEGQYESYREELEPVISPRQASKNDG